MQQMTQDATVSLDWKALQKALVFTKLVYRKPAIKRARKRARPDSDVIEQRMATVVATPTPVVSPHHHVDAFGETDERLLPWSRD